MLPSTMVPSRVNIGSSYFHIHDLVGSLLALKIIATEGQVFTWGCNDDGALGRDPDNDAASWLPARVTHLDQTKVIHPVDMPYLSADISPISFPWFFYRLLLCDVAQVTRWP